MTWKEYQEEVAEFFRALGLEARTDARVEGVRTHHNVDVLVTSSHAGFEVTWIVECKKWKTRVSKLHVLALREIVSDSGADRGILLSESGFQSGAIEAANLTNVQVTSLSEARAKSEHDVYAMRLRDLHDRTELCKAHYWDMSKPKRIEQGLRPEVGAPGYSATIVIAAVEELLRRGLSGRYPFEPEELGSLALKEVPNNISSTKQLLEVVDPMISDLEVKLNYAAQA